MAGDAPLSNQSRSPTGEPLDVDDYYKQFHRLSIDQKIYHTTAVLLSVTIIGCALVYLKFVLVPLTLAFFLSYFFSPVVDVLTVKGPWACVSCVRHKEEKPPETRMQHISARAKPVLDMLLVFKFPKWLAVAVSFFLAFLVSFCIGAVIVYSLDEFLEHSDKYANRMNELSSSLYLVIAKSGLGNTHKETIIAYIAQLPVGSFFTEFANATVRVFADSLLVMIIVVYLLLGRTEGRSQILHQIDHQIRHYIVLKVFISAAFGLLVGLNLLVLRVDLAVVFGLISFILNFIPTVGSIIAVLLPLPVLLLDPEKTWFTVLLAVLLPSAASFIFGWIVEPSVFGSSMQLNEITVLVALVFWGAMWGIVGAVLSVPILVVAKIVLEHMDHPIAHYVFRLITGFDRRKLLSAHSVQQPSPPATQQPPQSPHPPVFVVGQIPALTSAPIDGPPSVQPQFGVPTPVQPPKRTYYRGGPNAPLAPMVGAQLDAPADSCDSAGSGLIGV